MQNWRLVYCFSKLLSDNEHNFERILYSLRRSIEYNSKFHKLKIFTDKHTIDYLLHLDVEVVLNDYSHFRFLDDIKIQTLPLLEDNDILIDPDIFLFRELNLDTSCDLMLERPEKFLSSWYKEDYDDAKSYKFSKLIDYSSKTGQVGNIGIIKFFNKEFEKKYIDHYNTIKGVAEQEKETLPAFPKFSVLLGQLALQNLTDNLGYKVVYCKGYSNNDYIHLSGVRKYFIREFIDRMTKPKSII